MEKNRKIIKLNYFTFIYMIVFNLERIFWQKLNSINFLIEVILFLFLIIFSIILFIYNFYIINKYKKLTFSIIFLIINFICLWYIPYPLIRGSYIFNNNYEKYEESIYNIKSNNDINYIKNNNIANFNVGENLSKHGTVLIYKDNDKYLIEYGQYGFINDGEAIVYSDFNKSEMYGKLSQYCEIYNLRDNWYYVTYTCYK